MQCEIAENVIKLNNFLRFPYVYDDLFNKLKTMNKGELRGNQFSGTFDATMIENFFQISQHLFDLRNLQFLDDAHTKFHYKSHPYSYDDLLISLGADTEGGYQDRLIQEDDGTYAQADLAMTCAMFAENIHDKV